MKTLRNDASKPGTLAADKRAFGPFGRFRIAPVNTRFGAVSWFVWDAETADPKTGRAAVIRQASTEAEAVVGLPA